MGTVQLSTVPIELLPENGSALFYQRFLDASTADELYLELRALVPWRQEKIKIFGRLIAQPRLTASFADEGIGYSYSGHSPEMHSWIPPLTSIKRKIEALTGHRFNAALLNLYRDGNDSMGWHRDNEKELGTEPVIASVSLGAERRFVLRDHKTKKKRIEVVLPHGSLLVMSGRSQHEWEHCLPKSARHVGERINITFREVRP
jgi:alkylated DNA repair dioxygenase AlkB